MTIALRPRRIRPAEYLTAAICVAIITLMLWPLVMSFLASIKPPDEASRPPPHYLPQSLSFDNYWSIITYHAGLFVYVWNSLAVAGLTILFCLLLSVPAGYGLARFNIPGKEIIFLILLASMMLPFQALLVPLYLLFSHIGLTASKLGLAILHTMLQLPFSIYLMRNSFEAIPKEMEEAAVVDGASSLFTLRRVFLPLVLPGMVTVALFAFIASWNEFLGALILMNDEKQFTVPIMMTGVRTGDFGSVNWGGLQASVIISILPCLLIYVLLQRYYISGLLSGAVK
ncbi:MAG: carbohydrate ABC transporter permease [Paracoccaceae bacterium]